MIRGFLLAALLISFFPSFGQNDSILIQIKQLNKWTALIDSLDPFDSDEQLIDSLNSTITVNLLNILNDSNITNYRTDTLLNVFGTKSSDDKIFIFSFFENTGGSFKSNINIIQYRLPNGKMKAERLMTCDQPTEPYGGYIDTIYVLKSGKESEYFLMGGGISCNTCEFKSNVLYSISDESLNTEFCLTLDYRQGDGWVKFNRVNSSLTYEMKIFNDDPLYGTHQEGQQSGNTFTKHKGRYVYSGRTFIEK